MGLFDVIRNVEHQPLLSVDTVSVSLTPVAYQPPAVKKIEPIGTPVNNLGDRVVADFYMPSVIKNDYQDTQFPDVVVKNNRPTPTFARLYFGDSSPVVDSKSSSPAVTADLTVKEVEGTVSTVRAELEKDDVHCTSTYSVVWCWN